MIEAGQVDRWRFAWKLENVRRLQHAIPYEHPKGAFISVTLGDAAAGHIRAQLWSGHTSALGERIESPTAMPCCSRSSISFNFARDNLGSIASWGVRRNLQVSRKGEAPKCDAYEGAPEDDGESRQEPRATWLLNAPGSKGPLSLLESPYRHCPREATSPLLEDCARSHARF